MEYFVVSFNRFNRFDRNSVLFVERCTNIRIKFTNVRIKRIITVKRFEFFKWFLFNIAHA